MPRKKVTTWFDGFRKPSDKPPDGLYGAQAYINQSRQSERELRAWLCRVDPLHPRNALPPEHAAARCIPAVLRYVDSELAYPPAPDHDLGILHRDLCFLVQALDCSIREGLETTAEYACAALTLAVQSLRTETDGIGSEDADILWECREAYSCSLVSLVETCVERDRLTADVSELLQRRQNDLDALDRYKRSFQAKRDSGELDALLPFLMAPAPAPSPAHLAPAIKALQSELRRIQLLKTSLSEMDSAIEAKQHPLDGLNLALEHCRRRLSFPPLATDPRLRDRIDANHRRYRERLRHQLEETGAILRNHDVRIRVWDGLVSESIRILSVSDAIQLDHAMKSDAYHHFHPQQPTDKTYERIPDITGYLPNESDEITTIQYD